MDLSGIPTEDLKALQSKDLSKVSTATLQKLSGKSTNAPETSKNKVGYQGPPDVGLQPLLPTDAANKMMQFGADKIKESAQGGSFPVRAAATVGSGAINLARGAVPSTERDLGILMAAGPVMGAISRPFKAALPAIGDALADFAGAWTGKDPEYIKAVFQNPQIMKKVGDAIGLDIQKSAVDAINNGKQKIGRVVGALQDSFAQFGRQSTAGKVPMVETENALKRVAGSLESMGHRIPKELGGRDIPLKIARLDPGDPEYKTIVSFMAKMKKDIDFGEALNLKRQMDDTIHYGIKGGNGLQKVSGSADTALRKMRTILNKSMSDSLEPNDRREWVLANKAYENASKAYEELQKQVIGQTPSQTVFRMARNFRQRTTDDMFSRAAKIGKEAEDAISEIRDRVVAAQFKRRFTGSSASNIIPSSPRFVGQATALAGKMSPTIGNRLSQNPEMLAAMINSLKQNQQ